MFTDNLIPVANAIQVSPKRYALLLGAGLSVSAGFPTATDVSGNMIRKIASGETGNWQDVIPKGEDTAVCLKWFEDKFGVGANFHLLMENLGISQENRKDGLKEFIYKPDGDEGIYTPGVPTEAHRSIARLVKSGMISFIITTNFDTLLEDAMKELSVPFEIITDESEENQMSIFPDRCRILKVNGDFERGTLRITPNDLEEYDPKIENCLKQIFSEYGLVTCGWSGGFDKRLIEILCSNDVKRRYPVFWCLRDGNIPAAIQSAISPNKIQISDADNFFTTLEVVLERLSRFEPRSTLSAAAAVKKVQEALRDPRPDLSVPDLINSEADRVVHALEEFDYIPPKGYNKVTQFGENLRELERITTPLAAMCATLAYYEGGNYGTMISSTIDRLLDVLNPLPHGLALKVMELERKDSFIENLIRLRFYPAVLVIYASGIAAVQNKRVDTFPYIFSEPKFSEFSLEKKKFEKKPYFGEVNLWTTALSDGTVIIEVAKERFGGPLNLFTYPLGVLTEILKPIIPHKTSFYEAFDVFEFLFGLAYIHENNLDLSGLSPRTIPLLALRSRAWVKSIGSGGQDQMIFDDCVYDFCEFILLSQLEPRNLKIFFIKLSEASKKYCEFFKNEPKIQFGAPSGVRVHSSTRK